MDPLSSKIGAASAVGNLADTGAKLSRKLLGSSITSPLLELSDEFSSEDDSREKVLLRDFGVQTSLFCAILQQLQRVLSVADSSGADGGASGVVSQVRQQQAQLHHFRVSVEAVETTRQIVAKCSQIFESVDALLKAHGFGRQRDETDVKSFYGFEPRGIDGRDSRGLSSTLPGLKTLPSQGRANGGSADAAHVVTSMGSEDRVKVIARKSKIRTCKATIESCKVTLTLMVNVLNYAETLSARRSQGGKAILEDSEQDTIIQSLVSAHRLNIEQLAQAEIEDDRLTSVSDTGNAIPGYRSFKDLRSDFHFAPSYSQAPTTPFRSTGLFSLNDSLLSQSYEEDQDDQKFEERASVWLRRLIPDDSSNNSGRSSAVDSGFCSRKGSVTSSDSSAEPNSVIPSIAESSSLLRKSSPLDSLLAKWTDQAPHWANLHSHSLTASVPSTTMTNTTTSALKGPGTLRRGGIFRPGAPTSLGLAKIPGLKVNSGFARLNAITAHHVPLVSDISSATTCFGPDSVSTASTSNGISQSQGHATNKPIFEKAEFKFGSGDDQRKSFSEPVSPSAKPVRLEQDHQQVVQQQQQQQQAQGFTSLFSMTTSSLGSSSLDVPDDIDPAWGIKTQEGQVRQGLFS